MRSRFCLLTVWLTFAAVARAQEQPESKTPTWADFIAQGIAPYRQLMVEDFPVNDTAYPKQAFHVRTAVEPRYRFLLKPYNGFAFAYVEQWMIFSGLNTKETSRKSAFKMTKAELPYVQAILDLNEINARQLGAIKPGELPQGRGNTFDEATADLTQKMKEFLEAKYKSCQSEIEAFAKATNNGANKRKVRELATEISRRLKATPATTVQFAEEASSNAMLTPRPSPTATPVAASPSPTVAY